jgi:outer membrane protein
MNVVGRSCLLLLLAVLPASAEPLPFRRAIELAIRHSTTMTTAQAEQIRARAAYLAARDTYYPSVTVGSGLAETYGFPLSIEGAAPSIFNVQTTSFLYNPAQSQFVHAARIDWNATAFNTTDKRQQAVLDTALTYIQLDRMNTAISLLRQQETAVRKAQEITEERVAAGVDSKVEETKARLNTARVVEHMLAAEGVAETLRTQLAQLTGLRASDIEVVTESVPTLPEINQDEDLPAKAAQESPSVKLAEANAQAMEFRARGEHRQLYPAVDLVGQYGLFAKFNNYQEFFRNFQRNNLTAGVAFRFNFLNPAQHAKAQQAEAEATKARRQAQDTRDKVSTETLKLQRQVAQLEAAREVAKLEYELAQTDTEAVLARVRTGEANLRDQENARTAEDQKYAAYLDAAYDVQKAELQLLRATGELENWALQ